MLPAIAVGVVVFATTNIDDMLVLAMFFSDSSRRARSVLIGQFVGIGLLTVGSAAAAALAIVVPDGWIGLLGLAPLALGRCSVSSTHKRETRIQIVCRPNVDAPAGLPSHS